MFGIYVTKIDILDNEAFDKLLQFTTANKRAQIQRFHHIEDSYRSLLGDCLARYAVCINLGIKNSDLNFGYTEYKKPYLINKDGVHFNVSHSGDWVVCAIDSEPVGIDVELIKPIEFSIAKRFFSECEYIDLMNKAESHRIDYFYRLWTLKESYIKAIGTGLHTPLDSFWFHINNDNIILETNEGKPPYHFNQYRLDDNHFLAICCQSNSLSKSPKLEYIGFNELYNMLVR